MSWNQPGGAEPPKSRRPAGGGGAFDAVLSRWARRLTGGAGGGQGGEGSGDFGMLPRLLGGLLLAVWLGSGFYQIDAAERGVIQRFGKFQTMTDTGSGMGWHLPWPIETLSKVNVSGINSIDYQSRMLTSDVNLVNITCVIQYQYTDALKVLFQVRDPESTLREVSESAIREIVGQNTLDQVLAGASRAAVTANTRDLIQKTLDAYQSGIRVVSANLTEVQVPEAVQSAQRDANKAIEDRERYSKEAQAYANDLVPRAKGAAQRQLLDAEAYKQQVVAKADGDTSRFTQLANAYTAAPEVTRSRLYIDMMNTVLGRSRKVILDAKTGNGSMIYLPLDKLMEAGASRSAGNTSEITVTAPAGTAAGAPAAAAAPDNGDSRSRDRAER
jgi:membrane protease subunit HflK